MHVKRIALGLAAIAVAGATALFYIEKPPASTIDPTDAARVARGKAVYTTHCAGCHGAALEGQPEWRKRLPNGRLPAPPHDGSGHTWHHPDAVLVDIVKNGLVPGRTAPDGYQSDMPAYAQVLSDEDIAAVLAYIKSAWPPEALAMQKELSQRK
jgi:S-disulfanyl-L-cysteine oxidoreductase SoxD